MKLADWLNRENISFGAFGVRIERTAEAVRRYANGERIPDRDTMPKIVRETAGAVTANDFFDLGDGSDHAASDTTAADAASSGISGEVSAQAEGIAA